SIAERIRLGRLPGWASLLPLAANSWPVVAVTLWPLVLLGIAAVGVIGTETAIALATWLSLAALAVWGWTAGRIANSSMSRRLWSTGLDVVVGLGIVALKVVFH